MNKKILLTAYWLGSILLFQNSICLAQHVWVVGDKRIILYSNDGGKQWNQQTSNSDVTLNDVVFANTEIGWVVGENNTILNTTDGGKKWNTVKTSFLKSNLNLIRVYYEHSNDSVFVYSDETNDYKLVAVKRAHGVSSVFDIPRTDSEKRSNLFLNKPADLRINALFVRFLGKYFAVGDDGWVVENTPSVVENIRSDDDNDYWKNLVRRNISQNNLNDVFFLNVNNVNNDYSNAWIVGGNGTILNSNDGGKNWKTQASGTTQNLYKVRFINEKTGWVVGQNIILRTHDGGKKWHAVYSTELGSEVKYNSVFVRE